MFARVVRWRAVLQFDECEIFLGQRGGDLERFEDLGAADVNGRQIRNLVRLARILHPERAVERERVVDVLRYGSR